VIKRFVKTTSGVAVRRKISLNYTTSLINIAVFISLKWDIWKQIWPVEIYCASLSFTCNSKVDWFVGHIVAFTFMFT